MNFLFEEKQKLLLTTLCMIFAWGVACTSTNEKSEYLVLEGAILYDGTGGQSIGNSVIVIKGDTINCVGGEGDCTIPGGATVKDVSGKYITPGLIDSHVHFFQTGFFDSRPDALDLRDTFPMGEVIAYQQQHPQRYYNAYLCSGITGVYDVGGMSWSVQLQQSAEKNPKAPHVAAAGPLITPVAGAPFDLPSNKVLVHLDSKEAGIQTVQYMSALGSTGIKFWQLDADSEEYMERVEAVAQEIERQDNKMIAHATTLKQAKAALENGTKLLVHSVQDKEVDQEFIDLAKREETLYNPTLIVGSGYMLAYRAAAGIAPFPFEDPNGCVDPKTNKLLANASQFSEHPKLTVDFKERLKSFDPVSDRVSATNMKNLKKVYEAGIPIVVGTDAGNPGTLHGVSIYEEMEAMQKAGIPARDLIVMATKNGAMAMERLDDFGTLEQGKLANLIVLENDPASDIANMRSITHTMIKGAMKNVAEY
ncbi:amidohydrolase family protein [Fodinibius halophilus]|uniref:Amidohydrolase family protein n=1 Tax=Fodinibius halophilus TaxID=1736908 RepID=A0A6M1T716_9BACT|nr:amidohydrolase family protein [Fodinibius halophilus]NGP89899.1 amidohydrolase family protein [Fodinibius halophilus]